MGQEKKALLMAGKQAVAISSALMLVACGGGESANSAKTPEVEKGEGIFTRVCSSCHVISNENMVGPGLRGVIGRPVAGHPGYDYSDALKKDKSQKWTQERIQSYLMGPLNMYPDGRMAIAPLSPEDAKAVVSYLNYRQEGQ